MLKPIFIAVSIVLGLVPCGAAAQDAAVLEEVRSALGDGDVVALMAHSGDRLDLTVLGTSELLSRSQAQYVVRSFFAQYPPAGAEISETTETDDNWFASGRYDLETASPSLIFYVRLRRGAEGWELRELRFDAPAVP